MKRISKRITLVTLSLAMALMMLVNPAMAQEQDFSYVSERYETLGHFNYWPLEEKAAFSAWLEEQDDERAVEYRNFQVHAVPGENNLTLEKALDIARQSIIAKYDIKETVLSEKFEVATYFWSLQHDGPDRPMISSENPAWWFFFSVIDYRDMDDLGYYSVVIYEKTMEVKIYDPSNRSVG